MGGDSTSCRVGLGGLRSVVLYDVDEIFFSASGAAENTLSARMSPTAQPLEVEFTESGARYAERLGDDGRVEHRLELTLSGFAPECVARLQEMSRRGVVAILTLTSGGSWVVGYSPEGEYDYPLRLLEAESDSSARRIQRPTTRVLLGSVDGWVATSLSGV